MANKLKEVQGKYFHEFTLASSLQSAVGHVDVLAGGKDLCSTIIVGIKQ